MASDLCPTCGAKTASDNPATWCVCPKSATHPPAASEQAGAASLKDLCEQVAKHLGSGWLVIGPDGSTFQDETPHRAANAASKHRARLQHDPAKAAELQAVINSIRTSAATDNARLLEIYGTLDCPTCGGSGHIGDATPSPASPAGERDKQWRDLALQFDDHRMKALGWLRVACDDLSGTTRELVKAFLSAPPLSGEKVLAQRIAALATQPLAEQKPVAWRYRFHTDDSLSGKPNVRAWVLTDKEPPTRSGDIEVQALVLPTVAQPEQVAQDSAVLAYLDDLKDDAAAHIWPDDLKRCQTSECVVEVASVRMGSPSGKTVPLFSREQVVDAIRAARARGQEGAK